MTGEAHPEDAAAGAPFDSVPERPRPEPGAPPRLDLDRTLRDPATRVVVCCGSGGVGKTTTAAALALRAAEQGRRVVVLTIDPARRLAQALGLRELDNTPRRVEGVGGVTGGAADGGAVDEQGAGGSLDAMMLDMKRTFDEVVLAHASRERAEQIFANPFYQSLSSSFSGTQEYMAMEKLGQLVATGRWDLIVVDTPPSRSALDFLDAPRRLGSFLDGRFLRVLMAPAKAGGKVYLKAFSAGLSVVTGTVTKLLGASLLRDVQGFVAAMDTMFGGFRERAEATYRLLAAPGTAFVVVAAPERDALREASYFVDRLERERMPLAGLVLNRAHLDPAPELSAERSVAAAEVLEEAGSHPVTAALLRLHADRVRLAERERRLAARFTAAHPRTPVARVPAQPVDVHDLAGLRVIGAALAVPA
ncbi:ArsA family ATPase [Motilibacter aurantiacus]|uniref:ArsA family ATPase n=1 Tax=Motilibacter aurantiacus TaxID=2714955 RepID=UPI002F2B2D59